MIVGDVRTSDPIRRHAYPPKSSQGCRLKYGAILLGQTGFMRIRRVIGQVISAYGSVISHNSNQKTNIGFIYLQSLNMASYLLWASLLFDQTTLMKMWRSLPWSSPIKSDWNSSKIHQLYYGNTVLQFTLELFNIHGVCARIYVLPSSHCG